MAAGRSDRREVSFIDSTPYHLTPTPGQFPYPMRSTATKQKVRLALVNLLPKPLFTKSHAITIPSGYEDSGTQLMHSGVVSFKGGTTAAFSTSEGP